MIPGTQSPRDYSANHYSAEMSSSKKRRAEKMEDESQESRNSKRFKPPVEEQIKTIFRNKSNRVKQKEEEVKRSNADFNEKDEKTKSEEAENGNARVRNAVKFGCVCCFSTTVVLSSVGTPPQLSIPIGMCAGVAGGYAKYQGIV